MLRPVCPTAAHKSFVCRFQPTLGCLPYLGGARAQIGLRFVSEFRHENTSLFVYLRSDLCGAAVDNIIERKLHDRYLLAVDEYILRVCAVTGTAPAVTLCCAVTLRR